MINPNLSGFIYQINKKRLRARPRPPCWERKCSAMPWCPYCRVEYRPGFTHCADCGALLVETPPPLPAEADPSLLDRPGRRPLSDPTPLTTLPDPVQAGLLAGLLEENGLPSYILETARTGGRATALYLGSCACVCEVYVERAHLGAAQEFLAAYLLASSPQPEPAPAPATEGEAEGPACPPDPAPGKPFDYGAYHEYLNAADQPQADESDPPQDLHFMFRLFLFMAAVLAAVVLWGLIRW